MDELLVNQYLGARGIIISGNYFRGDKIICNKDIISQIELIVELHKTLVGCNFDGLVRLRSTIGKEVEVYKVQLKKLQRHYDYIVSKASTNEVDKLILSEGKIMLRQAKKAINYIYEHDYYGVIKRSMNREEICVGRADGNNLRRVQDKFQIGTVKGMSYNLVEEDLYNYIKKMQRREVDINEDELIKTFVYASHLSFNSLEYLKGLCSYPKDFFRGWERYKERKIDNIKITEHGNNDRINHEVSSSIAKDDKKQKSNEEILLELKKSLKYESKSFIK